MTSLFDVIAHEDSNSFRNVRQASVAAQARVEHEYGAWIRQDPETRIAHLNDEINGIVKRACEEYGVVDQQTNVGMAIKVAYAPPLPAFERTASIEHEAGRMPRMCPFHKDVTEISLNSGDPAAGFSAMAQHWGGPRHCEGEGYEGDSCKFKPQMTTQSWWDERNEKAEQRKRERAEQEELQAQQESEQAEAEAEFAEPLEQETELPIDNVVEVDFQNQDAEVPTEAPVEAEVPMSMAAKTADGGRSPWATGTPTAHPFHCSACGAEGTYDAGKGNPYRQVFAGRTCKFCGATGTITSGPASKEASVHQSFEPYGEGEMTCPFCLGRGFMDVPEHTCQQCGGTGKVPEGTSNIIPGTGRMNKPWSKVKTADKDTTGLGGPEPKMDKSKWSPKGDPPATEGEDSPHPTKRKDIVEPIKPNNDDWPPKEIGENVTEHQDVTKKVDPQHGKTDSWTEGPKTAISADVNSNPIIDMMNGEYDGFTPAAVVAKAIAAHKRH